MSRLPKWKLDKTKVKVVFRLQFHATHIPQTGWDKLFISFIPADSGKATAKTTKSNVKNGACKWGDPIYETTRLLQDVRTKQYDEKLYKFVVSMGSSRSSILGEANINLADYSDASKPSTVAMPLHGCDSGAILHVTVQLLTSKTGFREFEQQRELTERGSQTARNQSSQHELDTGKFLSDETANDQIDKVNARARFKSESNRLSSLENEVGTIEEYADSGGACDGLSNTSESLCAERQDFSCTHEIESIKSTFSGDLGRESLSGSPLPEKGGSSNYQFLARGSNDSVHGWSSDHSLNNDMALVCEENATLRGSFEVSESSIIALKLEVSSLQCHSDELGAECQKFSQQLAAEISSGQEVAKEVSVLRLDCLELQESLERLRDAKLCHSCLNSETMALNQDKLLRDMLLKWHKGLAIVEEKVRELQGKTCLGFHEKDTSFLNPGIEALLGAVLDLKRGTGRDIRLCMGNQLGVSGEFDVDSYQPEDFIHSLSIPGLISHETDSIDANNAMKAKIFELLRELDESKVEQESLVRKMGQMECYYESLIQELEENQKLVLGELQNVRNEHSVCLYTISATNAQMETMRLEMNDQIMRYVEDNRKLDSLNKELDRRAVTSEAALKRARLNYSIAVDKLQKDLELLSFQVVSMYESNEKLIRQAFPKPCLTSPLTDQNQLPDSEAFDVLKLGQNKIGVVKRQHFGRDMISEELKMSLQLQEELYQKVEEELCEMQLMNITLDVFARALKETLLDANGDVKAMKDTVDELRHQLDLAIESKDLVLQRLKCAIEDAQALKELNDNYIVKYNDMEVQNRVLEENLASEVSENGLLVQKISELEALVMEFGSFKGKYEASVAETVDIANLLKQEVLRNRDLMNEISSLQEKLNSAEREGHKLVSSIESLQSTVNFLQCKLGFMVAAYNEQFSSLSISTNTVDLDSDSSDFPAILSKLEEFQHKAFTKHIQLIEENKTLQEARDTARVSLSSAESEIWAMKQKFESDLHVMMDRIDQSNILIQKKLQLDLHSATEKIKLSNETEEKFMQLTKEATLNFDRLEGKLQEITCKNENLAHEILALEAVSGELDRRELTVSELTQENKSLVTSLQETGDESVLLESELRVMHESLRYLSDELNNERGFRVKLESTVSELVYQLKAKNEQLLCFDLQKFEHEQSQQSASGRILQLMNEKKDLEEERDMAEASFSAAKSEMLALKQMFECDLLGMVSKLETLNGLVQKLQLDLAAEIERMKLNSLCEERHAQLYNEAAQDFARIEVELQGITCRNNELAHEILVLGSLTEDLDSMNLTILELMQENNSLKVSLRETTDESIKLESELFVISESLRCLSNELHIERGDKVELERTISDLGLAVKEKDDQLLCLDQKKVELLQYKKQILDLELEKSRLASLLLQHEENLLKTREEIPSVADLEVDLYDIHRFGIDADVKFSFMKDKYEECFEELFMHLESSYALLGDYHKKHLDVDARLNQCLASEAHYVEETTKLTAHLESLKSDFDALITQNCILSQSNSTIASELEDCKGMVATAEVNFLKAKGQHHLEVQHLNHLVTSFKKEIDDLLFSYEEVEIEVLILEAKLREMQPQLNLQERCKNNSVILQKQCSELSQRLSEEALKVENMDNIVLQNEELEIEALLLKGKLDEMFGQIILLKGCENDVMKLQKQCNELSQKLSEEVLIVEELKSLSVHFKELKDKAEADAMQAREKKEYEGAMHDSLRIAFIKEQYETKNQELMQHLSISKKHGEEMLCKLQDAIDEVESRKKSEASHLKKIKELSEKNLQLEADLVAAITERREKVNVNDRLQAELECSQISLECCKEEKQKLEVSLQQCHDEKSRIEFELLLKSKFLENTMVPLNITRETSDVELEDHVRRRNWIDSRAAGCAIEGRYFVGAFPGNGQTGVQNTIKIQEDDSVDAKEAENASFKGIGGDQSERLNAQPLQDILASRDSPGIKNQGLLEHLVPMKDQFKSQNLKLSMDHLHNELEKMKRENSLVQDDYTFEATSPDIHRELMQLNKANEELGTIYPMYSEFSGSGKALERVLALEIELAESLQTKKKPSFHFQSSFLKQHSDEEAIFKSFRDINELIKDMLELKGKYTSAETELKEMHDRYSQLSLQFAEVEGERQKLMMTLKNVRASKKLQLNRSSSPTLGE